MDGPFVLTLFCVQYIMECNVNSETEITVMSYPMVHLKVAYRLLARDDGGRIEKPGDFLLGSVAPDAVHFHDEYNVLLKERSHLWKFGPRWGITLDSEGWLEAVRKFWKEHQSVEHRDFMAGYCTHLLTDWENDRCIWTPFREKMMRGADLDEVYGQYAAEAYGIDQWLYQDDRESPEIWRLLEQGQVYGVEGCIREEDLARQKQSLLYEQFAGKEGIDVSGYRFCTKEIMERFVEMCVEKISREIFS